MRNPLPRKPTRKGAVNETLFERTHDLDFGYRRKRYTKNKDVNSRLNESVNE